MHIVWILLIGSTISGLVAFLGNKLGRHVGRRKMTIFGLRPKYTSNVITVATGSMIFLITLGLAAAFNENVRIFLSGMDQLKQQKVALLDSINQLKAKTQAGPVFLPLQPMSVGVVECGKPPDQIKEQIDTLLALANQNALILNNEKAGKLNAAPLDEDTHLVGYVKDERADIIDKLSKARGSVLCQVVAGEEPAYFNDKIVAKFWFGENKLVFQKGVQIASTQINGHEPSNTVLSKVESFVYKEIQWAALNGGMMRNPLTNKLDTSIDVAAIRRMSDEIANSNKKMTLRAVANGDIYCLGPLDVRLEVVSLGGRSARQGSARLSAAIDSH